MEENQKHMEQSPKPSWLEELQLRSWEPEILLSGIVLYGMFKTPDLLDQAYYFFVTNISNAGDIENFVALIKVATYWLIFGLILHLVSRGIWVGMIGLSFTFPKGMDLENLRAADNFNRHLSKIPSIEEIIIRLEKVCSSLFSISFMLFMCIVGAYMYLMALLIIPYFAVYYISDGQLDLSSYTVYGFYAMAVVIIGLLALLDFLTLGFFLKRFKWPAKIYYPIYRFVSFVTLSRFYRPIYYAIITNLSKWKITVFLIFFVGINIYIIPGMANSTNPGDEVSRIELFSNNQGYSAFSGNYDDQNEDKFSVRAHIQSDIIRTNTIRLFVVADANIEDSILRYCDYAKLREELDTTTSYVQIKCIKDFYHLYIDDSLISDYQWKFHYLQKSGQRGYLTWIDVSDLESGLHELKVDTPPGMYRFPRSRIPFYREINPGYYSPEIQKTEEDSQRELIQPKPFLTE